MQPLRQEWTGRVQSHTLPGQYSSKTPGEIHGSSRQVGKRSLIGKGRFARDPPNIPSRQAVTGRNVWHGRTPSGKVGLHVIGIGLMAIATSAAHSGYIITLMGLVLQSKQRKACILALSWALLTCFEALAQKATVGRIVGHIDGISQDGDHYFLLGWACQQGQSKSINVQLFATQKTNGVSKEGPVFAETANLLCAGHAQQLGGESPLPTRWR
jgi:hypothetical protein